ncbi:MAG: hypothetical protein CMF37_15370 [Leeuwenhoekiella sp.]|nr:hypothetical protein [Leeuwenhoekiella sp.]MBH14292.1 hypothetical protein [Leeuwenhoekiella sp.]MBQ50201.1 hypothetical protein [Leeuwenhoekiella sp.]MBQ50398.1 hypothetical protein [Leeuwenhoekiella sp.]|tara:strand:- start:907 stop:2469 length:1563 start_codon:yes stop_codon:yes gene_type:complete
MKITIAQRKPNGIASVLTSHGDRSHEWMLSPYERTSFQNPDNIFNNANAYLEKLDKETQHRIWSIYDDIYLAFEEIENIDVLQETVTELVNRLYSFIDVDALRLWCNLYGVYNMPPDLQDTYSEGFTRELTYLRSDYKGLLFLTTALRYMVPIWGEYIKRNKAEIGTAYKEYMATALIGQSDLYETPEIARLIEYIEARIGNQDTLKPTTIHGGLGSVQQTDWLLSRTLLGRIAVAETDKPDGSIISTIYNVITNLIENMDKTFGSGGMILDIDRYRPKRGEEREDNDSVAENLQVSQRVSDVHPIIAETYVSKYVDMAKELSPTVPIRLVKECVVRLTKADDLDIEPFRVNLVAIIASEAVSIRSLHSLHHPELLRLIGVAQAILIHHGFDDLAHVLTARCQPQDPTIIKGDTYSNNTRSRLTKDNVDALMRLYPHYKLKTRPGERKKTDCEGVEFIEGFNKHTQAYDWFYNSPDTLLQKSTPPAVNGKPLLISTDIRNQLASMLLTFLDRPVQSEQTV